MRRESNQIMKSYFVNKQVHVHFMYGTYLKFLLISLWQNLAFAELLFHKSTVMEQMNPRLSPARM